MDTKKSLVALAVGASLIIGVQVVAQDMSKVEIKPTQLSKTVWMMEGAGGNLGVSAGEDMTFVVDDQFAPLSEKITAAVGKLSSRPVQFILNTHSHFDHTGGNENFGKAGAVIVAHENVRKRLSAEQVIEALKMKLPPAPKAALPVVTFTNDISFHLNGEDIRIFHVPRAHTDGDAIVHFTGSDVIHMGDTYFNGLYPFIDYSSAGRVEGMIAAADKVLGMAGEKTKIIPGHGPLSNKAELKAYRDMLATISGRVKQAIGEGKSDEDIVKAGVTKDFDDKWGKGFLKPDQFVTILASGMRKG